MRARVDKTGDANPHTLIDRKYSDQYFNSLERQFGLENGNTETRRKLKNIGVHYLIARHREDDRKMRQELRKENAQLAKQTNKFLQFLRTAPQDDIAFGLHMTALRTDATMPATIFPELSDHEQHQSGEPYFREFDYWNYSKNPPWSR